MTSEVKHTPELDEFEKAIRQIAAMPYYTLPLDEASIDSLFKRYNKAISLADDAVAKATEEKTASELFARWIEAGPKLAKAAGCYVGIRVSDLQDISKATA